MKIRAVAVIGVLLTALLPLPGRADQLDRMFEQLDRLERSFWPALQLKSDVPYHRETAELLSQTGMTASSIQTVASRAGSRHPNLTAAMNRIRLIFEEVEPASAKGYRFKFKYTSLDKYKSRFQKELPEEKRKLKLEPTMENVSVDDYEQWLEEIVQYNTTQIDRQKKAGGRSKTTEMLEKHTLTFFSAIKEIRLTLIQYRQENKIRFPEKMSGSPAPDVAAPVR